MRMKLNRNIQVLVFLISSVVTPACSLGKDNLFKIKKLERLLNYLLKRDNCQMEVKNRSVYLRGVIYTVDNNDLNWDTRPKEAIVVDDGFITYVGSNCGARTFTDDPCVEDVIVYDLDGAIVLPGIHDVHMHPLEASSPVANGCSLPALTDPEDARMRKALEKCPVEQKGTDWIFGGGHSITNMLNHIENNGRSPKTILDHYYPTKPVVMLEETSHSVWVNSKALEIASINANIKDRPGGVIMREKNSLEPNGILLENEGIRIMSVALKPSNDLNELNYQGLLYGLEELRENGITSVCDARLFWKRDHQKAWDRACDSGELTVRANLGLWAYPEEDDETQINKLKELYSNGRTGCSLRKSQIKLYSDGLLQSTTAMLDPYKIDLGLPGMTENIGMNYFDQDRMQKYIAALQDFHVEKGFDFHIHAIGDRGIHEALNAIENASDYESDRIPRHRLTHVEIVNDNDIGRFSELGVIADFQVAGDFALPSGHQDLEELISEEKARNSIPVKSMADTGAKITLSSDFDVSDMNPFVGIQHATERGKQSISVKTAIEMYTMNAAFAMRQEDQVGSLVTGKEADFIIIDQDILDPTTRNVIKYTEVLATIFKGKEIFRRYTDFPAEYFGTKYNYC